MLKQCANHPTVHYLCMVIPFLINFVYYKITNLNNSVDFDQACPKQTKQINKKQKQIVSDRPHLTKEKGPDR